MNGEKSQQSAPASAVGPKTRRGQASRERLLAAAVTAVDDHGIKQLRARAFGVAWAAFGAITFIGLLGSGLQLPDWALNLSPLTHVGRPPLDDIDATALAWLGLVAALLASAAFAGFHQRRVPQG
ncbi:hypothetical protein ACPPVT_06655 [Angustibacter sp. McL0619]|uniref:hypothetical protein n=1 Tax=Angustibacter sp. McL0619 TaxID=3415676 RepID=UPI003CF13FF9